MYLERFSYYTINEKGRCTKQFISTTFCVRKEKKKIFLAA